MDLLQNYVLFYKIPVAFRDRWYSENFGIFQQDIRQNSPNEITIDFSECEWADPIPLLGLLAELHLWNSSLPKGRLKSLFILLGAFGTSLSAHSQERLRKYLAIHGFITSISQKLNATFQYDDVGGGGEVKKYSKNQIEMLIGILKNKPTPLAFDASLLIPATILDVSSLRQNLRTEVDEMVSNIDHTLFKQRPSARSQRDTTLQRARQVLLELMGNARDHAYREDSNSSQSENGYVAVYGRVRHHSSSRKFLNAEDRYPDTYSELQHCPEIDTFIDRDAGSKQIEIFVCDVGRGITSDILEWVERKHLQDPPAQQTLRKIISTANEYPLREILSQLFKQPFSRYERSLNANSQLNRGSQTGLQHLGKILSYHADVWRIFVGREWGADQLISKDERPNRGNLTINSGVSVRGTFIHIGIKVAETPEFPIEQSWVDWSLPRYSKYLLQIRENLKTNTTSSQAHSIYDIRDTLLSDVVSFRENAKRIFESTVDPIVRAPRNFEKNYIYAIIDAWLETSYSKRSRLTICDLSRFQAMTVAGALDGLRRRFETSGDAKNIRNMHPGILVISEDFGAIVYQSIPDGRDVRFQQTPRYQTDLLENLLEQTINVALELRKCDTTLFWNRVAMLNKSHPSQYVLGPVLWRKEPCALLSQYLNFSLLVNDRLIARTVRRALRRLLALYPEASDKAIDNLIEPELQDAKKWLLKREHNNNTKNITTLLVGSVFVTGSTLNPQYADSDPELTDIVHIICAPVMDELGVRLKPNPASGLVALLWQEILTSSNCFPEYQRVPGTPFVTTIASELIPIPRFDNEYDRPTPAQMYDTFHSEALIKLGHWEYGTRHSLIEINSALAIEKFADVDSDEGFYQWLRTRLTKIDNGEKEKLLIIAFPNQSLASKIARTLRDKLGNTLVDNNTFMKIEWMPINYVPVVAGGMIRLSPSTLDQIKKIIGHTNKVEKVAPNISCVVLDIGFVTNKTFRHTSRQLNDLGISNVIGVGLMNRSSWPSLQSELSPQKSPTLGPQTYWRWQIPTLGRSRECILCDAYARLTYLQEKLSNSHPELIPTIKDILEDWKVHDLADAWNDHGVEPFDFPISLNGIQNLGNADNGDTGLNRKKRFGFLDNIQERDSRIEHFALVKEKNKWWHYIDHECSTTLVAHTVEIAVGTQNLSYALDLARKDIEYEPENRLGIGLELLATMLILSGRDMSVHYKIEYSRLLMHAVVQASFKDDKKLTDRLRKLLGLATLAFLSIEGMIKRELLPDFIESLQKNKISRDEARVALCSLICDADSANGQVGKRLKKLLSGMEEENRENEFQSSATLNMKLFNENFLSITLDNRKTIDLWKIIHEHFGRNEHHHGFAHAAQTRGNIAIQKHAAQFSDILKKSDEFFFCAIGLHPEVLIKRFESFVENRNTEEYKDLIKHVQHEFSARLVKVKNKSEYVSETTRELLRAIEISSEISNLLEQNANIYYQSEIDIEKKWSGRNIIPWCDRSRELLHQIITNGCKHGCATTDPWKESSDVILAHSWIKSSVWRKENSLDESGLEIEIANKIDKINSQNSVADHHTSFLRAIGGEITQEIKTLQDIQRGLAVDWFWVTLRIPFIQKILEQKNEHA